MAAGAGVVANDDGPVLPKENGLAPPNENPVLAEGTRGGVPAASEEDLPNSDPEEAFAPKLILGAVEKLDKVLVLLSVALIEDGGVREAPPPPKENPWNVVVDLISVAAGTGIVPVTDPVVPFVVDLI